MIEEVITPGDGQRGLDVMDENEANIVRVRKLPDGTVVQVTEEELARKRRAWDSEWKP
jgi:hypothetical protein